MNVSLAGCQIWCNVRNVGRYRVRLADKCCDFQEYIDTTYRTAMSYEPFSCLGSARNELIVEIFQKISGFLSALGSYFVVSDIARKVWHGKATDPYQRFMVGLSLYDIIFSSMFFLGAWLTPKETGWLWAVGNTASCTSEGFLFIFGGVGELLCQMAISFNVLMLIAFNQNQEQFAKKMERPIHIIIFTLALFIAAIPLSTQTYNPFCGYCYYGVMYEKCSSDKDEEELCIMRGNKTVEFVMSLTYRVLLFFVLIFCTIAMVWVYLHVRRQELRMQRYNFRQHNTEKHKESKRIRKILSLYTLSLYLTYGIALLGVLLPLPHRGLFLIRPLTPLLGFLNMLVYFLPSRLKYQKDHPGTWLVTAYFQLVRPCAPCTLSLSGMCCGQKEDMEDAPEMNIAKVNTTNEETQSPPNDTEP